MQLYVFFLQNWPNHGHSCQRQVISNLVREEDTVGERQYHVYCKIIDMICAGAPPWLIDLVACICEAFLTPEKWDEYFWSHLCQLRRCILAICQMRTFWWNYLYDFLKCLTCICIWIDKITSRVAQQWWDMNELMECRPVSITNI